MKLVYVSASSTGSDHSISYWSPCTYACPAVSKALYIVSKPYIICSANKHYTVRALRNKVASITANYSTLSPQSQRQYHIANVNTYELQIIPITSHNKWYRTF